MSYICSIKIENMKIIVTFGKGNGTYVDDRKPLEQVKLVKEFIEQGKDFEIVTCSPYVLEAIDKYGKDAEIFYYNEDKESTLIKILDEISEAFYKIQEEKE
jgi:hypothetical protein